MPLGRPSASAERPPPPSYTSNEKSELEAAYRQADARAQQLGAARAMEQGQNTVGQIFQTKSFIDIEQLQGDSDGHVLGLVDLDLESSAGEWAVTLVTKECGGDPTLPRFTTTLWNMLRIQPSCCNMHNHFAVPSCISNHLTLTLLTSSPCRPGPRTLGATSPARTASSGVTT